MATSRPDAVHAAPDSSSRPGFPRLTSSRPRIAAGSITTAAIAGMVAAAVAIAAAELLAGLIPGVPSLVIAVGALVISLQPPGAKDVMVGLFGTNDKLALNLLVVAVALAIAAMVGVRARDDFRSGVLAFVAFGVVAAAAAVLVLVASPVASGLAAIVAIGSGILVLRFLLPAASRRATGSMPDWSRRGFLVRSAGLAAGAVVAGGYGRFLLDRQHPSSTPLSAAGLPPASSPAAPLTADESLVAQGITPIVVPNDQFYRIDTALLVPQVDASTWQLKVTGMVDHPLTFSYDELLAMPLFEQYVTIACVSNHVGENLVGNTLWTGVKLKDVLRTAGVKPGATQLVGRAVDGFTVGTPTAWIMDPSREPMIAVGMNREPLPAAHGYPARLITPGLYGYVSATKWLSEIELTTMEAFDAYWVQLGWAKQGPILTQSRIDHPSDGATVGAGQVQIDGVAWAPDRGVSKVEVRIDHGAWQQTLMSRGISKATWVQWLVPWQATPGSHLVEVRATDGTGQVQTDQTSDPFPDGARGHHIISVIVQ